MDNNPEMKKPEERNEAELLRELVDREKKNARVSWIIAAALIVLTAVLLIAVVVLIPSLTRTLDQAYDTLSDTQTMVLQAQESLNTLDTLAEEAQKSFGTVNALAEEAQKAFDTVNALADQAEDSLAGINTMVDGVNELVKENTEALSDTVKKLNAVDFEKLQQAIEDLSGAVGILNRLFGRG